MRIIHTQDLKPNSLDRTTSHYVYNGLDCCVTAEVYEKLRLELTDPTVYNFELAQMAPAFEMMQRGLKVDLAERDKLIFKLEKDLDRLQTLINRFADATWGQGLNPLSPKQCLDFFYNYLGLPKQYKFDKGERKPTVNAEALESLQAYFYVKPICIAILKYKAIKEDLKVLARAIDSDGRMRCSYNIAGTETWRWSSSKSIFGRGANMQNITEHMRRIFIADVGYKLAYPDLEQAEARLVGACIYRDTGDPQYLEMCEAGDLHTQVARLVWPELPWTGDIKRDREIAESHYIAGETYRQTSKITAHASAYMALPPAVASHTGLPVSVIESFQKRYFDNLPAFPRWWRVVAEKLQVDGYIINLFGAKRWFFGRRNDRETLKSAVNFEPQSVIGKMMSLGLWRVWDRKLAQLLGNTHDAGLMQYPEGEEDVILPKIKSALEVEISVTPVMGGATRKVIIPVELMSGWNWSKYREGTNPDGLRGWDGHDSRQRTQYPIDNILHRTIR